MIKKTWNSTEISPPDELVEVMDKNNNIGYGVPTYYPFKMDKNEITGKLDVSYCEPYWDGGWMIKANGMLTNPIDSKIVSWRKLDNDEKS
jgi:hypothetical protein